MHLKTLTMKGFKSFAESVELNLEPGVTVVVGPNGSGKSNVVDAIAWVLGAQAPSAVRCQKMEDVVFAGSENRRGLGRAEVALTIDNSAGLLPTEFNEVEIKRTLFRTGDSEYSLNGVDCRLLDIQELLSDSGVGRTQHVIISQGQIDAVLSARPEERRLIIEEAAGVLKYRKRREKSERRLIATESNLSRIQDLLREVRRQLRPLEKQADAARRYGSVIEELRQCRIWLAGRELETLETKLQSSAENQRKLREQERSLKAELAGLDTEILTREAELSVEGTGELGDTLAALERLSQRASGAETLLSERIEALDRERSSAVDGDVVASVVAEISETDRQLEVVDAEHHAMSPALEALEGAEAAFERDEALFTSAVDANADSTSEAQAAGRAAEVRGELAALESSIEKLINSIERSAASVRSNGDVRIDLEERIALSTSEISGLRAAHSETAAAVDDVAAAAQRFDEAWGEARDRVAETEAVARSAAARSTALAEALDSARAEAGAEALVGMDGLLGTILDLVEIDEGFEKAAEAALGDLRSVVIVDSQESGREAMERLFEEHGSGSVLALGTVPSSPSPASPASILRHVRAERSDVAAWLHRAIGDVDVAEGSWREALTSAIGSGRVTVTLAGDRIAGDLWRVGVSGVGATAASLDEARLFESEAESKLEAARSDLEILTSEKAVHSAEAKRAAAAEGQAAKQLTHAQAELDRLSSRLDKASAEFEMLESQKKELDVRLRSDSERRESLLHMLPTLESDEAESSERARRIEASRSELDAQKRELISRRTEIEVAMAAIGERRTSFRARRNELDARLERLERARSEASERTEHLNRVEVLMLRTRPHLQRLGVKLANRLDLARSKRAAQSERIDLLSKELGARRELRAEKTKVLAGFGEQLLNLEIEQAESRTRLESLIESMRIDLDIEPDAARSATAPELDEHTTPAARARELSRDLETMGPINPLAVQEFEALQERHAFLQEQLDDIRSSRRDLEKVIKAVDEEIVTVFAEAYAEVADNFSVLFERLFPGGKGALSLTEPGDLLATGVEISARPLGKKVSKLSLLSGGERSLTALAFLFAIFRSRPSPFYVMDEVEAALDDLNLHRFLALVEEFRSEAQLVIVSHQKLTMETADTLYGVTMEPGGSSKVVSERSARSRSADSGLRSDVHANIGGR